MEHGEREVVSRWGSGFNDRKILKGTVLRAARVRLAHSGTATFTRHFLAAFFFRCCHRPGRQSAIQERQGEQEQRQAPGAEFAAEVHGTQFTYTKSLDARDALKATDIRGH